MYFCNVCTSDVLAFNLEMKLIAIPEIKVIY